MERSNILEWYSQFLISDRVISFSYVLKCKKKKSLIRFYTSESLTN